MSNQLTNAAPIDAAALVAFMTGEASAEVLNSQGVDIRTLAHYVAQIAGSGAMQGANNLSEIVDPAAARANLGALGAVPDRLGATSKPITEFDTVTEGGFYHAAATAAGRPSDHAYHLLALMAGADTGLQVAWQSDEADPAAARQFFRVRVAGVWSAWQAPSGGPEAVTVDFDTITFGTTEVAAHGLGGLPSTMTCTLYCKTTNHGWQVGEELMFNPLQARAYGITVAFDATNVTMLPITQIYIPHRTNGATYVIAPASWGVRVRLMR